MRLFRRTMTVTALVAVLVLATVGTALAADTDEPVDLDTLQANVVERIDARLGTWQERIEALAGRDGNLARQLQALFAEGITLAEQLRADVLAADDAAEVRALVREARATFAAHTRVHLAYAHCQNDLARFTHRVELLEQAITAVAEDGLDTTEAAAQADAARAGLADAAAGLAGVDPGDTGAEVRAQIRAAHRDAHSAQAHIRAGWRALADQLG
jgi:hypothetical protein